MEEIGTVVEGKTKFFKPMYVYHSVRMPGFAYEFTSFGEDKYRYTEYGRKRMITISENAVVTEQKHLEDDHHENYHPLTEIRKALLPHDCGQTCYCYCRVRHTTDGS